MDMQRRGAAIAETMQAAGRHDQRLAGGDDRALLADPHLGLARAHGQHLFHGVRMGRRASAGRDPLLEDAELRRAVGGRNHHAGLDARPPLFQCCVFGIVDFHGNTPFRPPDARGAAKQTLRPRAKKTALKQH